jgi:hypothetical protein
MLLPKLPKKIQPLAIRRRNIENYYAPRAFAYRAQGLSLVLGLAKERVANLFRQEPPEAPADHRMIIYNQDRRHLLSSATVVAQGTQ